MESGRRPWKLQHLYHKPLSVDWPKAMSISLELLLSTRQDRVNRVRRLRTSSPNLDSVSIELFIFKEYWILSSFVAKGHYKYYWLMPPVNIIQDLLACFVTRINRYAEQVMLRSDDLWPRIGFWFHIIFFNSLIYVVNRLIIFFEGITICYLI